MLSIKKLTVVLLSTVLILSGCSNKSVKTSKAAPVKKSSVEVKLPCTIKEDVLKITDKALRGRLVGTEENKKVEAMVADEFNKIGLDKYENDSYFSEFDDNVALDKRYPKGTINVKADNVVGKIKGVNSKDAIIISAHLDGQGWDEKNADNVYPGALDNASGLSILFDVAKNLSQKSKEKKLPCDIIILATNGEESQLSGSDNFASRVYKKYENLYDINFDCVGKSSLPLLVLDEKNLDMESVFTSSTNMYQNHRQTGEEKAQLKETLKNSKRVLAEDVSNSLKKSSFTPTYTDNKLYSDYAFFIANKIPAVCIGQDDTENMHKLTDTPDKLDYDFMKKFSSAITKFILDNGDKTYKY